jgi:DNA processing protein
MEMYWEWMCSIPGLYRNRIEVLMRCFQTPEAVFLASEKELGYLKEKGCAWIDAVRSWQQTEKPELLMHKHREMGIQFISCEHPGYPGRLHNIPDRPWGLFFKGTLPDEAQKAVALVGARVCTRYGRETAQQLAAQIARSGGSVISGAAYGIDGAAQWSALENGGTSYAVLGCGVDRCYPSSNRQLFDRLEYEGGILSEYPPGTPPLSYHFPPRNRMISGLADVVVVIEARRKSGSLITADYAAEQGKLVMAVPGRPGDELSEGCNELISQGAGVVLSVRSFIQTVFPDKTKKINQSEEVVLAPAEKLVYSNVDLTSKSLWELEACTALPFPELGEALMALELKGLIRETERGRYVRTK